MVSFREGLLLLVSLLCCMLCVRGASLVVDVNCAAPATLCTAVDPSTGNAVPVCGLVAECVCGNIQEGLFTADFVFFLPSNETSLAISTQNGTIQFPIQQWDNAVVQLASGEYSGQADSGLVVSRGEVTLRGPTSGLAQVIGGGKQFLGVNNAKAVLENLELSSFRSVPSLIRLSFANVTMMNVVVSQCEEETKQTDVITISGSGSNLMLDHVQVRSSTLTSFVASDADIGLMLNDVLLSGVTTRLLVSATVSRPSMFTNITLDTVSLLPGVGKLQSSEKSAAFRVTMRAGCAITANRWTLINVTGGPLVSFMPEDQFMNLEILTAVQDWSVSECAMDGPLLTMAGVVCTADRFTVTNSSFQSFMVLINGIYTFEEVSLMNSALAVGVTAVGNATIGMTRLLVSSSDVGLGWIFTGPGAESLMSLALLDSEFTDVIGNPVHARGDGFLVSNCTFSLVIGTLIMDAPLVTMERSYFHAVGGLAIDATGSAVLTKCNFLSAEPASLKFEALDDSYLSAFDCNFMNVSMIASVAEASINLCIFDNPKTLSSTLSDSDVSAGCILFTGFLQKANLTACIFRNTNAASPGVGFDSSLPSSVSVLPTGGANLLVAGCTFESCYGGVGGAIKAFATAVRIEGTSFSANIGGAVLMEAGRLDIFDSQFFRSSATVSGGAVATGAKADLFIDTARFINCTSAGLGGAVFLSSDGQGILQNSLFSGCSGRSGGGCASAGNSSISFIHTVFDSCSASSSGGAVLVKDRSTPTFTFCNLTRNIAEGNGGAAFIAGTASPKIAFSLVAGNTALNSGGGFYIQDSSSPMMQNLTVVANSAGVLGGGMHFAMQSTPSLTWCLFRHNRANISGGAFSMTDFAAPSVQATLIERNSASTGGGVSAGASSNPSFLGTEFKNNTAQSSGGGLISSDFAHVSLVNSTFKGNTVMDSNGGGGALMTIQLSRTNASGCTFEGNSAGMASGGAVFHSATGRAEFFRCQFKGNSASQRGGAVFASTSGDLNFVGSGFSSNSAGVSGGAVSISAIRHLRVTNCSFHENQATLNGGALLVMGAITEIRDSVFIGNVVASGAGVGHGGAVFGDSESQMNLARSIFRGNSVLGGLGGGVCSSGYLYLSQILFDGNSASGGGGLYYSAPWLTTGNFTLFNELTFVDNKSSGNGGGMVFFTDSSAAHTDDALYGVRDGSLQLVDRMYDSPIAMYMHFEGNLAGECGGGAYLSVAGPSGCEFVRSTFQNNRAGQLGGALFYVEATGETLMERSSFANNYAVWGGCNIGMRFVSDAAAVKEGISYKTNFTVPSNATGYQDADGFASYPWQLTYANATGCPGGLPLDAEPFDMSVGLVDIFGTRVEGGLLGAELYVIGMNYTGTDCSVLVAGEGMLSPVAWTTGLATYSNITLQGKDGGTCQLEFTTQPTRGSTGSLTMSQTAMECGVTLNGCHEGEVVVSGSTYDTCEPEPLNVVATVMIGLILALGCIVLLLLLFNGIRVYRERKERQEAAYYEQLEIEDELLAPGAITLEDILNDPEINRISWTELTVGKKIGRGASGVVTAAVWKEEASGVEQDVALKELAINLVELEQAAIEDFLVEIKLMSALRHSHVVRFLGVSYNEDTLYLVTELMQYGSLADVLAKKGKNLSWRLKMKLVMDAAKGMRYLHGKKLIHRDLKPQNLLVNNQWACKVADFGISRVKTATRTMTVIGTPVFMAPEVLNNERYSEKADVYSFGILLVQVFTGRRPYSEYATLNDAQLMFKIYHDGLRPSTAGLPGLLKQLADEALLSEAKLRPSFEEVTLRLARLKQLDAPEGADTAAPGADGDVVDFMDAADVSSSSRHSSASSATSSLFSSAPSMGDLTGGPSEGLVATGGSINMCDER